MEKVKDDIKKKLLLYPKQKIQHQPCSEIVKENLVENSCFLGIEKIKKNLYDKNTYLIYIRFYFMLPKEKSIFKDLGNSEELVKKAQNIEVISKIKQISSSIENFLPAKYFQQIEYKISDGIYAFERGYFTTEDVLYRRNEEFLSRI